MWGDLFRNSYLRILIRISKLGTDKMWDGYARRTRGYTRRTKMTRDMCDDGQRFEEDVAQHLGQDLRQVRARFEQEVGQDLGRVHAGHVQHMKFVFKC